MDRDYIYHESTASICPQCMERIPAKIVFKDDRVYLKKFCKKHGEQLELLEEDKEYYLKRREYDKPGTISRTQTRIGKGCPFDCGLCPEHDQHTCIGLIEITDACNLNCPICYAKSGKGTYLDIPTISRMLDFFIETEGGEAEILQISGGEPTLHPDILDIIRLARTKKIRYVMLNTNGLRIAEDEDFVKALAAFKSRFEVYLQFDGFSPGSQFRGKDLRTIKSQAIENLKKHKIPITLVTTVRKGANDHELGKIIEFGTRTDGIRGINFQPVSYSGRYQKRDDRITLSGIIKKIEGQVPDMFIKGDIVPLPCNVERVAVTYLARTSKKWIPITRNVNIRSYLPLIDNTFAFDADRILKEKSKEASAGCCSCMRFIKDIRPIIPADFALKSKKERLRYVDENTFRLSITSFLDVFNFDMKSMQKECVHIITPDLRKIPFSAYNMFHREKFNNNRPQID